MQDRIQDIIIHSLKELNEELEKVELENPTIETRLYGVDGVLDSLALVTLITDLEEKISEEFGKNITLADERAMSQRRSPFRDVKSLVEYIEILLKEENDE
ncbi:conserved hypothetical protein [Deferribacter desulfuricans SSM1]|uniref:Carrier domain-containing protein n=1 Tax=Deferribacter desulfuricans (strain DSM 14783 / JCM 11476 / NBRC 101012 / SSM1) TaxID=639282 RepID=D3PB92_DEFDS|nr:hypothetical protein [Deferribacter desulfuricans]BAI79865.1 conserved hypothetical protein [Deferribacter desulfuricans SSM1]